MDTRASPQGARSAPGYGPVSSHIFVDETKHRDHLMVAAVVLPADLQPVQQLVRSLVLPGQRRVHMKKESAPRKRLIADTTTDSSVKAVIFDAGRGYGSELDARRACLHAVKAYADDLGATRVVFEQDDSLLRCDTCSMALVAGIDSSTQACKVVVRDADSGHLVRQGRAAHPDGTEVDPARWWAAAQEAIAAAGGLDDVAAVAVGAQQHGLVCLDSAGEVVRPALLWNDTRSASSARDLVDELGGGQAGADAVGVVPVAAVTAAKLRWVADHEPAAADRTAAVCLPHDWLSWRLGGAQGPEALWTDRGDASGTFHRSSERHCPNWAVTS